MAVSQDLLEILRCPYCVSGDTRKPGPDPGRLELVQNGTWLVCQEPDCRRKYPIKEDVPVMLIEEGDKWVTTAVEELPEPGRLVEDTPAQELPPGAWEPYDEGSSNRAILIGLASLGLITLVVIVVLLLRRALHDDSA